MDHHNVPKFELGIPISSINYLCILYSYETRYFIVDTRKYKACTPIMVITIFRVKILELLLKKFQRFSAKNYLIVLYTFYTNTIIRSKYAFITVQL